MRGVTIAIGMGTPSTLTLSMVAPWSRLNSTITLMISMSKSARDHSRNKVKYDYDKILKVSDSLGTVTDTLTKEL